MSAAGRWGLALLAVHAALLFAPPIPPVHKGTSAPSYAWSLLVVALLTIEVWRQAPALLAWWRARRGIRVRSAAAGGVAIGLTLALAWRALAPEPFRRASREEGFWEPLTLVAYLAGAILLARASGGLPRRERRPWHLLVAFYAGLALEEVDYFGIVGGVLGRIEGEYAGALHDLIRLVALGIVGPAGVALLALLALATLAVLWRLGYVTPEWLRGRLVDPRLAWALAGLALLGVAALEEAHVFGWTLAMPTPEEAIELAGGACLAIYALEAGAASARSFDSG